ncbi:hypothetical protein [Arthrobacter sp. NPDC058127]|uniref:hypothetical protein n=1 Tax=Arthrobacter sp. NPDC058127 TaxID=3346351 RepID=UPI0036ED52A9
MSTGTVSLRGPWESVPAVPVAESLAGPTEDEPGADIGAIEVGAIEQEVINAIKSTTTAKHR